MNKIMNVMTAEDIRSFMRENMAVVNAQVTLHKSDFPANIGDTMYNILSDLILLQGRKEAFFNATDYLRQYNKSNPHKKKRMDKWTSSKRFKEIIEIWDTQKGVPKNKLYLKKRIGRTFQIFVHHELFLNFMIRLDAEHEVAVTNFINKAVSRIENTKRERGVSKGLSLPYTNQLKRLQQMLKAEGSGFSPHTYTNIQRWVYEAGTGRNYSKDKRDAESLGIEFNHDGFNDRENHRIAELRMSVMNRITVRIAEGWTGKQIKDDLQKMLKDIK